MYFVRILIFFAYMFFAGGICIQVFKEYKINYSHIFELTFKQRVNPIDLFKVASGFFVLFSAYYYFIWSFILIETRD